MNEAFEIGIVDGIKVASPQAMAKANEIKRELKRKYRVTPYLSGSLALGTNLPGESDFDYGIPVQQKKRFLELYEQFKRDMKESPYNRGDSDYRVFTTTIGGEPVDVALIFGGKGAHHRDAIKYLSKTMTEKQKQKIIEEKAKLKGAWIAPKYRYKRYKRNLDTQLGIPRFSRWQLDPEKKASLDPRWQLGRSDVYGHRTSDITGILSSGQLMSAYELARKGKLKSYEHKRWSRGREEADKLKTPSFRSEVFVTKGLLPADSTYGQYGVLVRSRKAAPSPYLNMVPDEHTVSGKVKGKLTFVVPDSEIMHWRTKYPNERFITESQVPDKKRIQKTKDVMAPVKRALKGKLRISHAKQKLENK
jgi:hypothetical protein